MPRFGSISGEELIRYLRQLGFDGPYSGGRHRYMNRERLTLRTPDPHQADIGRELLIRILRPAGIGKDEWEQL